MTVNNNTKNYIKKGLLKLTLCTGKQQNRIVVMEKLLACILMKLPPWSGVGTSRYKIDIMHFGDIITEIKFELCPDTQSTNPIGFGSNRR